MTTRKITIAGKEVTLAYCCATEIAFYKYTHATIAEFDRSNPEHILYIILACIIAWSQFKGEEPAVKDEDLMYNVNSKELVAILNTVFELCSEWYDMPLAEKKTESAESSSDSKNA